jgi:hypothetical protein
MQVSINESRTFYRLLLTIGCGVSFLVNLPACAQGLREGSEEAVSVNRAFGIVPVVHAPTVEEETPALSPRAKFLYFTKTTLDPGVIAVGFVGAAIDAPANEQPAYGGGAAAFGQKVGAITATYAASNLFSKAILPTVFHQDPRYFRKAHGSIPSRIFYAASQSFVTRTDRGGSAVNVSFLGGYAASVALSNAYYPDRNRNASDAAARYGLGIGVGVVVNVVREFWRLR